MKRETFFLRAVVILAVVPVLALGIFGLPSIAKEAGEHFPAYVVYPAFIGIYGAAIPFFFALYQTLKLLSYIDKNTAFSELSIQALKNIKFSAVAVSVLYAATMPLFYFAAELDDAPGLMAIGLAIDLVPIVIAVFAAVLEKLLENAISIKSENDLTV